MSEQRLLTAHQAARYLGISRSTLYATAIRRVRIGRAVRFDVRDLDAFIELHATRPPVRRPA